MYVNKFIISSLFLFAFLYAGCATSNAPSNWLPDANELEQDAFGGWITLITADNGSLEKNQQIEMGEFIALDSEKVYIMKDSLLQIMKKEIISAKLEIRTRHNEYGAWATIGTLSTISNGVFLIFTFPLWLVTDIAALSGEAKSDNYVMKNPDEKYWKEVNKFARFPQGLLKDIDRSKLRPKAAEKKE